MSRKDHTAWAYKGDFVMRKFCFLRFAAFQISIGKIRFLSVNSGNVESLFFGSGQGHLNISDLNPFVWVRPNVYVQQTQGNQRRRENNSSISWDSTKSLSSWKFAFPPSSLRESDIQDIWTDPMEQSRKVSPQASALRYPMFVMLESGSRP